MAITKRTWLKDGVARAAYLVTTTEGGKRRRRQFPTRAEAEAYLKRAVSTISTGAASRSGVRLTIAEIVSQWADEAEQRAARGEIERSTAEGYQTHAGLIWAEPLAHIDAAEASFADFENLARVITAASTLTTARNRFTAVRMAIGWGVRKGYLDRNRAKDVKITSARGKRAERGRVPGRADLKRLAAAILPAAARPDPDVISAFFATALFTGARLSEILALTEADVDLARGLITISKRLDRHGQIGPPKSVSAYRSIPIAGPLASVLTTWLALRPATDPVVAERLGGGLVFANTRGRPLNGSNIRYRGWVPLMRRAGLADGAGRPLYRIHDLRHAAASVLIDQGLEAKMIQHMMGHSSVSVTLDIYGHLFADDLAAARIRSALESGFGGDGLRRIG
jgi:integrase